MTNTCWQLPGVQTSETLFFRLHNTTYPGTYDRESLLSPSTPEIDALRVPSVVHWLSNVALRDLALHEKHGACVDVRGDVYQWNGRTNEPLASLTGKVR